jgi:riboflavin synthase
MFTGIIEYVGSVVSVAKSAAGERITVRAGRIAEESALGDSIAVNGACLTVSTLDGDKFTVDVSPETMRVTTLGDLGAGNQVNLERAMSGSGRFGGHIVLGHVDVVGTVSRITPRGEFTDFVVNVPAEFRRYLVPKGSVTVNGVSLTVADRFDDGFSIALIPVTLAETTLGAARPGDRVNLEADILGKYVWHYLHEGEQSETVSSLTMDKLNAAGFIGG